MRDGESPTSTNVSVEENEGDHIKCHSSRTTDDWNTTTSGDDEQQSEHVFNGWQAVRCCQEQQRTFLGQLLEVQTQGRGGEERSSQREAYDEGGQAID